ncbi:MAG TPA: hypothetical protein EYQ31_18500, partial [Candidatus Handelsmanbacteria bacterium]|nr:hypothetical protein [Candidatus Handelsmanbacteria bacterium]
GLDAAMEARQETDRFIDVWQKWTVGNYAAAETGFGYGALGQRRVQTLDVEIDMLPLENAPLGISGRWGTANVLFRTPGDLLIDFDASDDVGRVINPMIVEGQIHGGVVHGIGNALFEQMIFDENAQNPWNTPKQEISIFAERKY